MYDLWAEQQIQKSCTFSLKQLREQVYSMHPPASCCPITTCSIHPCLIIFLLSYPHEKLGQVKLDQMLLTVRFYHQQVDLQRVSEGTQHEGNL